MQPRAAMTRALTLLAAFLFWITVAPSAGRGVSYDTVALGGVASFALVIEGIDADSKSAAFRNPLFIAPSNIRW
jgi:hypothetical protein